MAKVVNSQALCAAIAETAPGGSRFNLAEVEKLKILERGYQDNGKHLNRRAQDNNGSVPLALAASRSNLTAVNFLIAKSSLFHPLKVSIEDTSGFTALSRATMFCDEYDEYKECEQNRLILDRRKIIKIILGRFTKESHYTKSELDLAIQMAIKYNNRFFLHYSLDLLQVKETQVSRATVPLFFYVRLDAVIEICGQNKEEIFFYFCKFMPQLIDTAVSNLKDITCGISLRAYKWFKEHITEYPHDKENFPLAFMRWGSLKSKEENDAQKASDVSSSIFDLSYSEESEKQQDDQDVVAQKLSR